MNADHMGRIADEHLIELERAHGRIKHVVYNGVDLVFRKPKRTECHAHAAKLDNPQEKISADEQLAQLLIVQCGSVSSPAAEVRKAFLSLLDDYPYLVRSADVGTALAKLSGLVQDDEAKSYGSASTPSGSPLTSTQAG